MQPDNVFEKSQKGREEIEKRTHRLDSRRRTLLIMVDGRASAGDLARKAAHIPDAIALLQSLWAEGFVEPVGEVAEEVAPPVGGMPLDELKRAACQALGRLMGPDGDSIALKLERAPTREAFFAEAAKARAALASFLGPRRADEFWKSLGP